MSASVYVGILLSEKKAMNLFGGKYENKVEETCPRDKVPNPNKNHFCYRCGQDLRYRTEIKPGVENIEDLDNEEKEGLEMIVTDDANYKKFVLIGKEIAKADYNDNEALSGVEPLKINEKTMRSVARKLEKLGIAGQIKTYVVAQ